MRAEKVIAYSEVPWCNTKIFFTCERTPVNENNWGMDAHFNLFGTQLHTHKPILILWISIVFILGRNRFYYSKIDCIGMKSWAPLDFTGHLRFWLQKYLVQNLRELFTVRKSSPLLFLQTLSRWKWKMNIWENCNAKGKMTKNKCLSYKIRWLVSPISCWTSPAFRATLLGWWMNGKFSFLNKVAFQFVCKCLWCLYNKQNNTWLLVDMGLLFSISHERVHWTRDISSW